MSCQDIGGACFFAIPNFASLSTKRLIRDVRILEQRVSSSAPKVSRNEHLT